MSVKEPNQKEQRYFNKFKDKAKTIVNDHNELKKVLEKLNAKLKASERDDSLKDKMINYLKLIGRMLSNTISGTYTDVPWQTLVMIVSFDYSILLLLLMHCLTLYLLQV